MNSSVGSSRSLHPSSSLWTRSTVLSLPTSLVRILVAPTLILCLGLHGIYSNSLYDVGKDLWYFSGPVVYISFGYLVFERLGSWQRLVQPLVVIGAYSCLVTIVGVVSNREQLLATTTVEDYRRDRRARHICSYFTDSLARFHETCRVAHDRGNTPNSGKGNHLYPVGDSGAIHIFQNPHGMPGRRASSALSIRGLLQEESEITRWFSWAPQSYWHSRPAFSIVIRWAYF